jgi:hypothetical protein
MLIARSRRCLVAIVCCSITSCTCRAAIHSIAFTGQQVPGLTEGVAFGRGMTRPTINAAGQVGFWSRLIDDGMSGVGLSGFFRDDASALHAVALEGESAPQMSEGITFAGFHDLELGGFVTSEKIRLTADGQMTFVANLAGPSVNDTNNSTVWSETMGPLHLLAREGDHAVGISSEAYFDAFTYEDFAVNSSGETILRAALTGSGIDPSNDKGIWLHGSAGMQLIAREGAPVPGMDASLSTLGNRIALNEQGQTAFQSLLEGSSVNSTNNAAIWLGSSAPLELVARAGSRAPGTPAGVYYDYFADPGLNAAGQIAFAAAVTGGYGAGIWSGAPGSLSLVARALDPAPGVTGGAYFGGFYTSFLSDPTIVNSEGSTAFRARIAGTGITTDNDDGIWSEGFGPLALVALVAREDEQAPGTPEGVLFDRFFGTAMNALGQTAFVAELRGDVQRFVNDRGIWAQNADRELKRIIRTGDELEVAPGDVRTIEYLAFATGSGNEDGRASGFNDTGRLAFFAEFTDLSTGIFVSDGVAISPLAAPGDFNRDGVVNAADYTVWRDNLGAAAGTLVNDPNAGAIGIAQYDTWKSNFGETLPLPGAIAAVPEPTASMLLTLFTLASLYRDRTAGKRC